MSYELIASNPDTGEVENNLYCSMQVESKEGRVALYNAMANPNKRLADMINCVINVRDVIVETVEMKTDSGERQLAPRVILIDMDGISYVCVSTGIFNAVKRMFGIFGPPTWEDGMGVKVKQLTKGKNNILTLELI